MATAANNQYQTEIISNGSKWAGQAPDPIELLIERLGQYALDPAFLSNRGEGTPYQHATEGSDLVTFSGNFTTYSGVFRIRTNDPALVAQLAALIEENETVKAWRAEHAGPKKSYYGTFSAIRDRHKATAAAAPGVEIPGLFELAERAHSGTSFSPEKRAESCTIENKAHLAADLGKIHAAGLAAGADAERIQEAADRYQAGFIAKLTAWLSAKGRCISTMITGASNFPVRRAEKANSSEHNRLNEFIEYYEKGLARAIKSLSTPPSQQEVAAKYTREAEQLVAMQEKMKAANKIVRAAKGADCTEKLLAAGLSEKLAAEAQKVVYGRAGFPAWMLQNNLANIKRVQQRAAEETAKSEAQLAARTEGQPAARSFEFNGWAGEVVLNLEADRIQLIFEGKPDEETRSLLKRKALKWSPRYSAWQRQNTLNARYDIGALIGLDLNAAPATVATEQPAAEPVQEVAEQLVAEQLVAEPVAGQDLPECLNCCTDFEPTATSAPGFCQYCTENNLIAPPAAETEEAEETAKLHFHPTKHWHELSAWQRKQYAVNQAQHEVKKAEPAAKPTSTQLSLFDQPAEPVQEAAPEPVQLEASTPATEGWHVIARPVDVAPEHVAELEQLRDLVQALPTGNRAPSLYEVVQLAQQLPAASPFHVEGRADGLAIGYGPAEVLRLAPAGSWPPPASNYPAPRSRSAAPLGSGYVPPRVAPVRPTSRAQVRLLPTGGLEIYLPGTGT